MHKLSKNLVLIYTGKQRTAKHIAKSYVSKLSKSKEREMYTILNQVNSAKKYLKNNDLDSFGDLLNENWMIKRELSNKVTNSKINEIYKIAIDSGALGGKLLGAGGGGFLLFYIKSKNLKNSKKKLYKLTFVDFNLSNDCSKLFMKQNKNFNHPLMHDNFTKEDLSVISKFVKSGSILTQNKNVFRFEKLWSKWLGVKYSVFVNSGSSANYLTFACLKYLYGLSGEVIVPSLTWVSDVVSVIRNGFKPVFVDINLNNLSMNEHEVKKKINKRTKVIFITHAQGFNGFSKSFLNLIKKKNIILIEDVCESHGAKHKGRKLGTFGLISNFSFYYAHHLSTIEGGMICTNNKEIYEVCRILRGHGMLREVSDKKYEKKIIKKYKNLSPKFIFMYPGFNFRNNEIGAILEINQLKRLNKNIILRRKNFNIFLRNII